MTEMKGITCCGECAYYNVKKHKCTRYGVDNYVCGKFYDHRPLPNVGELKKGKWTVVTNPPGYECSFCFKRTKEQRPAFCPNCGADMRGDQND